MKVRILSSLIMLPLIAVLYLRGPILWALSFLISIIGITELYKGFEAIEIKPSPLIGYASAVGLYAIIILDGDSYLYQMWFLAVTVGSLLYLFNIEKRRISDSMATMLGCFYVVLFSSYIVLIDKSPKGAMVWVVILSAAGTDIFAYFVGSFFGRHKLCPKISPKKTIEGAVGGIAGSVIFCTAFGYLIFGESIFHFIMLGLLGSIAAQAGDLTASIFKRKMGIKDYGHLIPGHGGILDRFDSVLFTAPFVYYYVILVM